MNPIDLSYEETIMSLGPVRLGTGVKICVLFATEPKVSNKDFKQGLKGPSVRLDLIESGVVA